jgi:hypothetical protein
VKVYFGGAEKGSYLSILLSAGVTSFGVNLTQLSIPKRKELILSDKFEGGDILVYTSESDEDLHRFDSFIRQHEEDLDVVICPPNYGGEWLGEKYVPIWNDKEDLERLAWLCQKHGQVALSDKAINSKTLPRINQLHQRWGTKMVALTSKVDSIDAGPWDSVVVGSWTSVIRYGETQVWDGHGLRRYPAQQKESARKRHRADILRLGVDFGEVMEDSVSALGLLSIRSWQAWASSSGYDLARDYNSDKDDGLDDHQIVAIGGEDLDWDNGVSPPPDLAIGTVIKRHEDEKVLLPGIGIETITSLGEQTTDEQGQYTEIAPTVVNTLASTGTLLRQCDSCYLAARCPAFKEHSECGFKLPVEIRTKDQLNAAMRVMIEIQASRVLFARFAEELEGQGLDPALSAEMDRLFSLIDKMKSVNESREMLSISMETRGTSGVLSRLFGAEAGRAAQALPGGGFNAEQSNRLLADITDAEVVD